jgi:tRNA-modifying protein YgfZ
MTVATARLDPPAWRALRLGTAHVTSEPSVFEVTGPGALTCLQGLLTNDLERPGAGSLVYGALLTPKGMVVVDYWVVRLAERFLLVARPEGREATADLLRRQLPPRLARSTDQSGAVAALYLFGPGTAATVTAAGLGELPAAGRATERDGLVIATPDGPAPFSGLVLGNRESIAATARSLSEAGATSGDATLAEAARILAGWPRLGAEIEEKTLPQEIRYDEIGGVSYQKGCYVGQETVARLHFRGHANRGLRGLRWTTLEEPTGDMVTDQDGKDVGTVRSILTLGDRRLGIAMLRREVGDDGEVTAAGLPAVVVALPFPERSGP